MRLALSLALLMGSLTPDQLWWLEDFREVPQQGQGVVVAVIDTGIDASHPDLAGVVVGGTDLSGLGTPRGTSGVGPSAFHGTMVASLIAGQGSEASGVLGAAPGVELLSVSIGLGVPGADTDDQIAKGIIWAVDNGADIINLSLTRNSPVWPRSWDEAFSYAFENGVVVVAAAGNRADGSGRPSAPATIPGVVSVGGVNRNLEPAEASVEGLNIAVVAPAEGLLGSYPSETYRTWDGSSAAAPLVSGLLARMLEKDPAATANDLIARLISSAEDLGDPGVDAAYGFGLIQPALAVESTVTSEANPLGALANWIELYRPSATEDSSELVLPATPKPQASNAEALSASASLVPQSSLSAQANGELNPILYWLLVPLAPLLWFALRRGRKVAGALDKTKGKPQHDRSDN